MSHKVHASWSFGHDSQANQGAFSKGACGHGMQKLGWIFLPQLGVPALASLMAGTVREVREARQGS